MITSIFSKSKPINFIIVAVLVIFVFVTTYYNQLFYDFSSALSMLSKLGVVLFLIFLLDFIVSKNKLTQNNSYAIMVLGLLFFMFPGAMRYSDLLFAGLFNLFALRRLINLHSKIDIKKKLFDAAFWIGLAALFYFWSILFFALVIVALIYYSQNDLKNVIIPFVGLLTILILFVAFNILFHDTFFKPEDFNRFSSLDLTPYNTKSSIIKLTVLATLHIWILVYFFRIIPDKNKKLKPTYFIIAWASIIAVLVAIIAPEKNGSEFIFLFVPFSIMMANYVEVISERWFKEVFVALLIITPLLTLLL